MLFSIIVPVYNVEKYVETCIQSILGQNYSDYELILVDDGSTDCSGIICDEYGKKHHQAKVIHQKNGGLSFARNTGIREATGEYLVFVDSDDWIDSNALEGFEKIIRDSEPDIIETKVTEEYGNRTVIKDPHFSSYLAEGFDRKRALDWILYETDDTWPAWKRICKRSFILEHDLFFAEGRLQEDIDWTTRLCCCAQSFCGYDQPWYHYRLKREGSITNNIRAKYITDIIEMAAVDRKYRDPANEYSIKAFDAMICSVYIAINLIKNCSKEDKTKVQICIKQNMWLFDYTPTMKYKLFSLTVRIIGVDHALRLLSVLGS